MNSDYQSNTDPEAHGRTLPSKKNFRLGTLNVHNFVNGRGEAAYDATVRLLRNANLDVIALQEVGRKRLPALCSALDKNSEKVWNCVNSAGCAILSPCSMESKMKMGSPSCTPRCCAVTIELLPGQPLEVASIHLNHHGETTRIKELDMITKKLVGDPEKAFQSGRMVWMGDFNALTESDYTTQAWNQISDTRARNCWEAPQTDVTRRITDSSQRKRSGLGMTDAYQEAATRSGPLSTCRFDTRIDYIFLSPGFSAQVVSQEHIEAIPFASDHNLVVATLNFD